MTQKVDLHIEELVLHGFSPGDRFRIGEAVELELTRLITEQGIPSSLSRDGEVARTDVALLQDGRAVLPQGLRPPQTT